MSQPGYIGTFNNQSSFPNGFTGTLTKQNIVLSGSFTTTSNTFVDVTGLAITLPTRTGGLAMLSTCVNISDTVIEDSFVRLVDNASNQPAVSTTTFVANYDETVTYPYSTTLSGQVVKVQVRNAGGVGTVTIFGTGDRNSRISSLELS